MKDEAAGRHREAEGRRMREGINRCSVERTEGEWWMRTRPLSAQRVLQRRTEKERLDIQFVAVSLLKMQHRIHI